MHTRAYQPSPRPAVFPKTMRTNGADGQGLALFAIKFPQPPRLAPPKKRRTKG